MQLTGVESELQRWHLLFSVPQRSRCQKCAVKIYIRKQHLYFDGAMSMSAALSYGQQVFIRCPITRLDTAHTWARSISTSRNSIKLMRNIRHSNLQSRGYVCVRKGALPLPPESGSRRICTRSHHLRELLPVERTSDCPGTEGLCC